MAEKTSVHSSICCFGGADVNFESCEIVDGDNVSSIQVTIGNHRVNLFNMSEPDMSRLYSQLGQLLTDLQRKKYEAEEIVVTQ